MTSERSYRPTIRPVPDGVERPTFSVMIPHCNGVDTLRETLASVLVQDPGPERMQIEVVDNCSDVGDPAAVIEELGHGRVEFYRQCENVGPIRNFNICLQRSRGRLVHLLHADDTVRDGFYGTLRTAFEEHPEIGAAFCRMIHTDENGIWKDIVQRYERESGILRNWLQRSVVRQRIDMVSMIVRRDVYETIGGFDERLSGADDWEFTIRVAARYPVWYETEALALHRTYPPAAAAHRSRTVEQLREYRRAVEIVSSYLPDYVPRATADRLLGGAREFVARNALYLARHWIAAGRPDVALRLVEEALGSSRSHRVVRRVVELLMWTAEYQLQVALGKAGQWRWRDVGRNAARPANEHV